MRHIECLPSIIIQGQSWLFIATMRSKTPVPVWRLGGYWASCMVRLKLYQTTRVRSEGSEAYVS